MKYDVKDLGLASEGIRRIEWSQKEMPVLGQIHKRFIKEKPLSGMRIGACLHVTTETAYLAKILKDGGAEVAMCASNPLSTQDDVAAALVSEYEIPTFSIRGEDNNTYYQHLSEICDFEPNMTMDDGADMVAMIHQERTSLIDNIIGGSEETTTGIIRLRSLASQNKLMYPVIAVNDADTKHLFDNRYGTGQSTLDGITRATNILWAGKTVVVAGYGWCGKGIAQRADGMGSHVIVTEVDPVRALEAVMDGYRVMKMEDAAKIGDVFITVTGGMNAVGIDAIKNLKSGAIIANSGHFNVEIDIESLEKESDSSKQILNSVKQYTLYDGRQIFLLGEGRLINLAAAEGHPSGVMDLSFAGQALAAEFIKNNNSQLSNSVHSLPTELDKEIARLKLQGMSVDIDVLSEEQEKYLNSWDIGT
ncbi:MAG: adenosylhomocysteinase [Chloroflexi bacterium]|nr:adenosylhomocysteinase [Chloroflexota bacterium]